jgi:DNA-binding NtrC family response regulator
MIRASYSIARVQSACTAARALEVIQFWSSGVIVLNLGLAEQPAMDVLRLIRQANARVPLIVVVQANCPGAAIESISQGAYDCLFDPLDVPSLVHAVKEALLISRNTSQRFGIADMSSIDDAEGDEMLGSCGAMQKVFKAIGRVADQNLPVLITGESGTGKELVARAICRHGRRANQPFLALNCAAIPEHLLESELFGHERGAFTGADRRRIGKFEQCSGGTLFLDEIGDMTPPLQAKILRVLQEQSFERVGGNETINTDVRIIAATNHDLKVRSEEGSFRHDLYYRLGVFTIDVPPLRKRGDDLAVLIRHFLRRFSRELGREAREIAPDALAILCDYGWPGNIRELQSVIKQALLRACGDVLQAAFLPEFLKNDRASPEPQRAFNHLEAFVRKRLESGCSSLYADVQNQVDRILLPLVMEHTLANQQNASRLLGIARQTLRLKMRDLGLRAGRSLRPEEVGSNPVARCIGGPR